MTLFGVDLSASDTIGRWVLHLLAVAGAAAVGGLTIGLITQGLSRLLTTRPVPRTPLQIIRVLGAIVSGWLLWMLLISGFGGGGGSGSGWWPFGGAGSGPAGTSGKESTSTAISSRGDTGPRETGRLSPPTGRTLQIEVLPRFPAIYRVQTAGGPREFVFEELKAYLLEQKKATPPLTALQVSEGSSAPDAPAVTSLTQWARDNGLTTLKAPNSGP